jgi:hypothetical protein
MAERHEVAEMIGEGMREVGVLVAVFGMLDKFLRGEPPTAIWTASVLTIGLFFFVSGLMIERQRR